MNSTGVVPRRGFAILVLLAAVVLAAYLVHARLGEESKGRAATPAAVETSESAAPGDAAPGNAAPGNAAPGDAAPGNAAPGNAAPAAPPPPAVGFKTSSLTGRNVDRMGSVVVDSAGWTAYRFDRDTPNPPKSNCYGECAVKWPPITVDGDAKITGIDPAKIGKLTRDDGTVQLTLGGWPLYRFAADGAAAKWKGQAVNDSWWVVAANGKRNLSCLPEGANPPAA
jgi:predicted lipoprotein with Yx(FWY)xxD motif